MEEDEIDNEENVIATQTVNNSIRRQAAYYNDDIYLPKNCTLCELERNKASNANRAVLAALSKAREILNEYPTVEFESDFDEDRQDEDAITLKQQIYDQYEFYEKQRLLQYSTKDVGLNDKNKQLIVYPQISEMQFYNHVVRHNKSRTQQTILRNDNMSQLHDQCAARIKKLGIFLNRQLIASNPNHLLYKVIVKNLASEARALQAFHTIMCSPMFININAPRRTIKKN